MTQMKELADKSFKQIYSSLKNTQRDREGGEGGGRGVQDAGDIYLWPILVDMWQKPSQYCKVIIFQLK